MEVFCPRSHKWKLNLALQIIIQILQPFHVVPIAFFSHFQGTSSNEYQNILQGVTCQRVLAVREALKLVGWCSCLSCQIPHLNLSKLLESFMASSKGLKIHIKKNSERNSSRNTSHMGKKKKKKVI